MVVLSEQLEDVDRSHWAGKDDRGQMNAVGPFSTNVEEDGLVFTGMCMVEYYCILEYVPEQDVEVVGFMYDISGPVRGGNSRCLLKVIPFEARGTEWFWTKSRANWKARGNLIWSRSSTPTGDYMVRVMELDSREVWATMIEGICLLPQILAKNDLIA